MWILFAISSNFSWAVENVATKIMVGNRVKNPYVFSVLLFVLSVLPLLFIPAKYIYFPAISDWKIIILSSALYVFAGLPYLKAMGIEEVTRINIWWNLIPVFNFVLGIIFLNDLIGPMDFMAIFFLMSGAMLTSLKFEKINFKFSKAFLLMVFSCFLYSVYAIMIRFLSKDLPAPTIFFWVTVCNAFLALIFLLHRSIRLEFLTTIKNSNFYLFLSFLLLVVMMDLGNLFNTLALSLRPGVLVYAFEGLQVLFVFLLSMPIIKFFPSLLQESLDRRNLLVKLFSFIFIMIGLLLLI
jgi:drug/metabolite transporter (DMT)-like permease